MAFRRVERPTPASLAEGLRQRKDEPALGIVAAGKLWSVVTSLPLKRSSDSAGWERAMHRSNTEAVEIDSRTNLQRIARLLCISMTVFLQHETPSPPTDAERDDLMAAFARIHSRRAREGLIDMAHASAGEVC